MSDDLDPAPAVDCINPFSFLDYEGEDRRQARRMALVALVAGHGWPNVEQMVSAVVTLDMFLECGWQAFDKPSAATVTAIKGGKR